MKHGHYLLLHNLKPILEVQQSCIADSTPSIEVMTDASSQDIMGCRAKIRYVVDLNGHLKIAPLIQHTFSAISELGYKSKLLWFVLFQSIFSVLTTFKIMWKFKMKLVF